MTRDQRLKVGCAWDALCIEDRAINGPLARRHAVISGQLTPL